MYVLFGSAEVSTIRPVLSLTAGLATTGGLAFACYLSNTRGNRQDTFQRAHATLANDVVVPCTLENHRHVVCES